MAIRRIDYWLTEDGLLKLGAWARDGLTDDQIAKQMKVSRSTLFEWRKKEEAIAEALAHGKEVADVKVENELYRNATGYEYEEEVAFKVRRVEFADGKKVAEYEELQTVPVKKWHPGETGAQCFWLKNRKPEVWKEKPMPPVADDPERDLTQEDKELLRGLEDRLRAAEFDSESLEG